MKTIKQILNILTVKHKYLLAYFLFLMIIGMVVETLSIGLIIPILKIFTDISVIYEYPIILDYIPFDIAKYNTEKSFQFDLIIYGSIFLLIVYLLKSGFLVYLFYIQAKIIYILRKYLSFSLFKKYVFQPYFFHLNRHSADLLRIIIDEIHVFTGGIRQILILISELLVVVGICLLVLYIEPKGALLVSASCAFAAILFYKITNLQVVTLRKFFAKL